MKRLLLALVAVGATACLDFEDPTIPERRAPAILQANMRILGGIFQVDGSLAPGRDESGVLRVVQVPQIHASEFIADPRSRDERGVHDYQATFPIAPARATEPFRLVAPAVRGTTPPPPVVWHGLIRADPDTLRLAAGADITLRVDTAAAPSQPAQRARQWFVEVRRGGDVFRINADGAPPRALRIPVDWLGGAPDAPVLVSMIYYQSAQVRTPDNTYIANVLLDHRLNWVVLYDGGRSDG